ncbi:MAG: chemotaxis protein CheW [candidate division WOR-3 bacterium]
MDRFVEFMIGEKFLAIRVQDVLGFAKGIKWCRLPLAPEGVVGICNWHGKICPLVDLGVFLGTTGSGGPWICAAQGKSRPIAILVDAVTGIETAEMTPVEEDLIIGVYGEARLVLNTTEIERLCGI